MSGADKSAKKKKSRSKKYRLSKFTLAQVVYLFSSFYVQNSLYTCAAACAYSFFFSVIPIIMITLSILVWLTRSSPSLIAEVISYLQQLQYVNFFDVGAFVERVLAYRQTSWVNVVSVLFAFWMARKLFATTMQGMKLIFRGNIKNRFVINQLIVFAGEVAFVVVATVIILLLFGFRLLLTLPIFSVLRGHLEWIGSRLSVTLVNFVAYLIVFIFVSLVYRFSSRTKPSMKLCVVSSALCTVAFFIVTRIMLLFMNFSNYNLVYGVLASLMILLLEIYIFFLIFFGGAQLIYVVQFFSTLLIGELYLLPPHDTREMKSVLRRILFINPVSLMDKDDVIYCAAGDVIYKDNENSYDVYYIAQGSVVVKLDREFVYFVRGDFFGAVNCLLETPRNGTAVATVECKLIKFNADTFRKVVEKNPKTAEKALKQTSIYS